MTKVYGVELGNVELGVDFKIVSTVKFDEENCELGYDENGLETPFNRDVIKHLYYIGEHNKLDVELAIQLGLGVIEVFEDGSQYLYNADMDVDDDNKENELLRLGMYYQISYPNYHDVKLDVMLNKMGMENYIRRFINSDKPITRLKEIFKSQKGKENNVVQFKKGE